MLEMLILYNFYFCQSLMGALLYFYLERLRCKMDIDVTDTEGASSI